MTGRRGRKKMKSLSQAAKEIVSASSPDEDVERITIKLPIVLLEVIFSRLNLKENIRASAVCRRWLAVATSVRVANKPPLLMFLPKVGNLFNFYDPSLRKMYCLEMPELEGNRLCYSKYGWLLMFNERTDRIFFFCPYTRESIELPKLLVTDQVVFSSPPTSPDCIVITVRSVNPNFIRICTCRPGASQWTKVNYQNIPPFVGSIGDTLCFCQGRLYCMSVTGWLGVYDQVESAWFLHSASPPMEYHLAKMWRRCKFITEHEGNLFMIYICESANPVVCKLDQTRNIWTTVGDLGGLTLFASSLSSDCKMDLLGNMRNNIYFSEVRYSGKRCVTYSLSSERYYPRKRYDGWRKQDPWDSIWIEPPEDLSVFL